MLNGPYFTDLLHQELAFVPEGDENADLIAFYVAAIRVGTASSLSFIKRFAVGHESENWQTGNSRSVLEKLSGVSGFVQMEEISRRV